MPRIGKSNISCLFEAKVEYEKIDGILMCTDELVKLLS